MNRFLVTFGALAAASFLVPTAAEAQRGDRGGGVFRSGGGGGFGGGGAFRGGFRGGGFAGPAGGFRGGAIGAGRGFAQYGNIYRSPGNRASLGYGGRPGFYGRPYRPVYGYGYGRYGYGRRNYGGAVAAGLIGGLALGGLGYGYGGYGYGYGYPVGYGYGGYGYPAGYGYGGYDAAGYDDGCTETRRRVVTASGRVVIRRVQVCTE